MIEKSKFPSTYLIDLTTIIFAKKDKYNSAVELEIEIMHFFIDNGLRITILEKTK